ncbi:flagellar hook capping FlgD N-terminal domain-containing protein [Xinfangfangia sp. CPCC 101601]|uniref:Basal-body rod modification protein FlgD n=1 Tax=Pseudogemmobacter lacusdianii TaxID=3069608 RepID=A0ABU0VUB1_9RHOB|nr:flagellar hook capping FlgD N-terminal domain-containing protein [Xinfangfangia sp. CPCC 101601]MDQ2065311.1 flagellar hook capping FlgD N-terminal domain-containing protein [Xinfangfangia sp. CPCC 101601]
MNVNETASYPSPAKSSSGGSSSGLSADFTTFLKMLTVQMQNQDPMNPIESSDYAVQLATFSGVEQQVRSNQLLEALAAQFSLVGMSQLAGWVGQEARAAADVWYSGMPVTLAPNPVANADSAVLVVKDQTGAVVSREGIPVSTELYQWFGGDAAGNPLPEGRYSLSLESVRAGEVIQTDPMEYYGRVIEARGGAGGVRLVFAGGIEVLASDITALRAPPS